MKVKTDFVTNSSSTCFIVVKKDSLTLEDFLNNIGIDNKSIFIDEFKEMYKLLVTDLVPAIEFVRRHRWSDTGETLESFIKKHFSNDTWSKVQEAQRQGYDIMMGSLSSDETHTECLLCTDDFIIDMKQIFFDGSNNAW